MNKKLLLLAMITIASMTYAKENIKTTKLDATVVSIDRYADEPILESGRNVSIVTSQDIENKGAKNIEEALSSVPSLDFIDGKFAMRGQVPKMGDKTMIVLVNGVPQNNVDNRVVEYDFIPMDSIDKIEVLPSGGATMYGGNASSGIINIITKKNPDKKVFGKISFDSGSYDKRKVVGNVGGHITNDLVASVTYKVNREDGYRDSVSNDIDYIDFDTNYKLNNGNLGFKYSHNKRTTGSQTGLTYKQYEENSHYNPSFGRKAKDMQDKYVVTFDKKLNEDLNFNSVFEYRDRKYNFRYPRDNKKPSYVSRDKRTKSFYTNLHMQYKYLPISSIILGFDYQNAHVNEKGYKLTKTYKVYQKDKTKTKYESIGGYALNKINYDDFIFTQGIRIERNKFDENKDKISEKGKIDHQKPIKASPTNMDFDLTNTYKFDENKSIYLSFNRVKRSPNLNEYTSWDEKLSDKKSQTLNTVELGTKALFNEKIYVSAATYYIRGDKEIMYDPAKEEKGGSFYNFNGKTERSGLELYSEQYFDALTLRQNATFMRNKIKNGKYAGKTIPGVPNFIGGVGATYEIIENLMFNVDTKYLSKTYFANDFENKFPKYKSVTLTNINLRYNFQNGMSVHAGIDNVFNEKYSRYNMISGRGAKAYQKYTPGNRRTYSFGIEYKF